MELPTVTAGSYEQCLCEIEVTDNKKARERLQTKYGIVQRSPFSYVETLAPAPFSFPIDPMHLIAINIPELTMGLWRGSLDGCDDTDWIVLVGECEWATP
jgi:hypothetical protein